MSNINEGIKDYLPRGGFFRDEDGNKQGGYIGQGTDEQLRKAKIIAKVKAYEAEPGKRFMAGRVSSEDLKNFDDFARRYEEYFGETVDEACGKKKAKKKLKEDYDENGNFKFSDIEIKQVTDKDQYSDKKYKLYQNGWGEFVITPFKLNGSWILMEDSDDLSELNHYFEKEFKYPGYNGNDDEDPDDYYSGEIVHLDKVLINDPNAKNEFIFLDGSYSIEELLDDGLILDMRKYYQKSKNNLKESDKEADDAEWKTIRKNAKANPSLYGGRYTDKDAKKAKREWMKDKKSLEEDVNIDLADWGLEDLNETSEEMSVEPEEELDEMFFYDETEDEIEEERPLPKNRFKEDPEFYRHEDLEELRSRASDDDIDKVYRLSRDEVKDHNEWLKKHGKKNLMTEACKERKHKSWKKVVDSYYGKKAKSKLQESLENFESDYPEMEEFAAIEVAPANEPACEPCKNPEDCVCMNVPLIMRVLEFAKESNLSDEDLHKLVQKAVELCANGCCLSMDNYDELVACCQAEAPAEEEAPVEPEMEQSEEDEEIDFSELMF